ncbi:MAG: glycosyltransferase family 39 protein [Anaerolineaceae bacterium]|nr:glycosyltransferase family 39 protein [Anaerolineaceae bacterium]
MLITFTLAILIALLFGHYFFHAVGLRVESLLLHICLSMGVGLGIVAILHFVITFFTTSQLSVILTEGICCLLLIGFGQFGGNHPSGVSIKSLRFSISGRGIRWTNVLTFVLALISLLILGTFVIVSLQNPHGGWDAWSIWNQRARFLYRSGLGWQLSYAAQNSWSHPDYPFFLPITIVRIWRFMGAETTLVPVFLSLLFFFLTTITIHTSLTLFRGKFWGVVGTLLLIGSPGFILQGTSQYADIPLSFYFLLTWFFLALCTQRETAVPWALVGISTGLSTLVKNEGLLFAPLFFAAFFTFIWLKRSYTPRNMVIALLVGFMAIFAFVIYFKLSLAPQNDLIAENNTTSILQSLGNPSRYALVGRSFLESATNLFNVPLFVFPLLWFLFGIDTQRFKQPVIGIALLTLVFMIIGYFFVYITTPYDLEWHLKTSLSRLFIQLWPSLVFISIMMVPEMKWDDTSSS